MTPSYGSGELVWDTTEATAPRWILLLDGPPGAARESALRARRAGRGRGRIGGGGRRGGPAPP